MWLTTWLMWLAMRLVTWLMCLIMWLILWLIMWHIMWTIMWPVIWLVMWLMIWLITWLTIWLITWLIMWIIIWLIMWLNNTSAPRILQLCSTARRTNPHTHHWKMGPILLPQPLTGEVNTLYSGASTAQRGPIKQGLTKLWFPGVGVTFCSCCCLMELSHEMNESRWAPCCMGWGSLVTLRSMLRTALNIKVSRHCDWWNRYHERRDKLTSNY